MDKNEYKTLHFHNFSIWKIWLLKRRLVAIAATLLFIRIIYAGLLYIFLGGPKEFKVLAMDIWKTYMPFNWLYLFCA